MNKQGQINIADYENAGTYDISRTQLPSREAFHALYDTVSKPAIFTDIASKWPALQKWSLEWFKQQHGDKVVPIQFGEIEKPRDKKETRRAYGIQSHFTLGNYIDSILSPESKEKGYLSSFDLFALIPTLLEDVDFPKFHDYDYLTSLSAWMGIGGSKVHCDYANNLFVQISGRKVIQLYSPNSILKKYPARWSWYSCFCDVDLNNFNPTPVDAELFKQLKPDFSFVIHPGEMMFLPYGWWHRVLTPEPSISVNRWWMTPSMLMSRIPIMPLDFYMRGYRKITAAFADRKLPVTSNS